MTRLLRGRPLVTSAPYWTTVRAGLTVVPAWPLRMTVIRTTRPCCSRNCTGAGDMCIQCLLARVCACAVSCTVCRVDPWGQKSLSFLYAPLREQRHGTFLNIFCTQGHSEKSVSGCVYIYRERETRELSLAVQWGVAIEIERAIKKSARFC